MSAWCSRPPQRKTCHNPYTTSNATAIVSAPAADRLRGAPPGAGRAADALSLTCPGDACGQAGLRGGLRGVAG